MENLDCKKKKKKVDGQSYEYLTVGAFATKLLDSLMGQAIIPVFYENSAPSQFRCSKHTCQGLNATAMR